MNDRFVVIKTTEGPGAKIIIYRKKTNCASGIWSFYFFFIYYLFYHKKGNEIYIAREGYKKLMRLLEGEQSKKQ